MLRVLANMQAGVSSRKKIRADAHGSKNENSLAQLEGSRFKIDKQLTVLMMTIS